MKYDIVVGGNLVTIERLPNGKFKKPELSNKYKGYKYSICPLKQVVEEVMVFQKPTKTGSPLHDTLAYENGDKTITVSAVDIDGNRVGTFDSTTRHNSSSSYMTQTIGDEQPKQGEYVTGSTSGRYPSQTFISPEAAEVIDRQSGVKKGSIGKRNPNGMIGGLNKSKEIYGDWGAEPEKISGFADTGGASKILHKCPFEQDEHDLYFYAPKVSKSERQAGVEANGHPTLKPISLNTRILKLFKTPNPQRILLPFAGSGSEVIGAIKAGFEDWEATELNPEYVEIAKARIEHWSKQEEVKQMELI